MSRASRTGAALILAGVLGGAPALAQDWPDADQRAALHAELRAYLLAHPEIIAKALAQAEARRNARHIADDLERLDSNRSALFHNPADWTGGNPAGDVTLVSFIDYATPASARALAAARDLIAQDPGLRLVVKEAPLPGDDAGARAARFAQAVLHVAGPDTYLRAQQALFAAPDFSPDTVTRIARDLDLDPDAVRHRMDAPETASAIAATQALARALDLGPAPAHVLERTLVRGDVPTVALARIVAAMRRKIQPRN
ncbi:MAG: thioredoxin domain-containing protein [Rhodobacteraceae bacterium]|nr:thioredoxin domain-containing protein [Paracoccaceae bacterium]